ncbi:hypothetical protein [Parasitella parasitica]|uniref:CUE domain-containing protein n=1 Tax=Parasitella parasitica TaxID=35722 RepID=A0A0B7N156_9FUNG|nr:hypothetical protein [Parasitella parasitica]
MSNSAESKQESKPNQVDSSERATVEETAVDNSSNNTKEFQDEPAAKRVSEETADEPVVDVSQEPSSPTSQEPPEQLNLPENVRILKEAFPDTDVEVIEAVLQAQNDSVESSFEILLGMSDPAYNAPPNADEQAPPMPPRPQARQGSGNAPYAYWERQAQPEPTTVEEQLRMDEELAKRLALEDERAARNRRRSSEQPRRQQQPQNSDDDDDFLSSFQDELPIIKEKMKEAGNAAKKKMMDLYNQFKANTQKNNPQHMNEKAATSSMPTTNAQYRGLPSDDGDDLLTGDISALHLSDYDVYKETNGRPKKPNDYQSINSRGDDVIHVNPPMGSPMQKTMSNTQTSTSDAQLKADEDFARQLAEEEQIEARRSRNSSALENSTPQAPPMPARKTVVIAPKSPLELEGDSDYEDIRLTAAPATNNTTKRNNDTANGNSEESASVPYVIGDDDDSDSDDLVDIEDELKEEADEQVVKKESVTNPISSKEEDETATAKSSTINNPNTVDNAVPKSTTENTT